MCHPARGSGGPDGLVAARRTEYAVLTSDTFGHVLLDRRVVAGRMPAFPGVKLELT